MKTSSRVRPIPSSSSVSSSPGAADERQALAVLLGARRLADEHQVGVGVAGAEDDLRARLGERAARAVRRLAVERDELLAAVRRLSHRSCRRGARARAAA